MNKDDNNNRTSDDAIVGTFGNIAFWVSDVAKSRHFFSDILGIPELAAREGAKPFVFYGNPATFTFSINKGDVKSAKNGWTKCPFDPTLNDDWKPYMTIYVNNLQAVIDRCNNEGIPMRQDEPFSLGEGFGISVEIKDPDGNTWAVTQR